MAFLRRLVSLLHRLLEEKKPVYENEEPIPMPDDWIVATSEDDDSFTAIYKGDILLQLRKMASERRIKVSLLLREMVYVYGRAHEVVQGGGILLLQEKDGRILEIQIPK